MRIKEIYSNFKKEDKLFKITTICSLSINLVIGLGKWILAIFSGVVFFVSGVVNILMGLAKLVCYIGLMNSDIDFKKRNLIVSILVFASGLEYFIYMLNVYLGNFNLSSYETSIALIIALVSFIEIGVAISGLIRLKGRGRSFRNIKLINFVLALEALVLTETAILSFTRSDTFEVSSSLFGLIVGIFVMVLSIFMVFSPYITIANQEKNDFILVNKDKNNLVKEGELILSKSFIYGDYVYKYKFINEEEVSGEITKKSGFWKRTHILIKILLIILSEILIFVWLIGRFIYFLRCSTLIKKLKKIMEENGFKKVEQLNFERSSLKE